LKITFIIVETNLTTDLVTDDIHDEPIKDTGMYTFWLIGSCLFGKPIPNI